jgi:hypothetical protein
MLSQACHSGKPDPKQRTTQALYPPACGLFRTLPYKSALFLFEMGGGVWYTPKGNALLTHTFL